ncbi:sulfite exporter TauE/SafE family protein [Cellulomonas sp. ATA003]|uniref:sulfite exporter TauE/SafE family protein n=1 Tax=Cellulomonas sp. ATA003 TaxID=3073064 RepID=UPI0028735467|nr:sulfite exporter TauE/SafE family protein [Cellulomonas sp. ATA003]WNB86624.1 sulfite exporter TauE/SafE family protein [Cellulomonas sp. ATA003]
MLDLSGLDLSVLDVCLLALAASLVGVSKTALPGAGTLTVAVFAAILPARQSTGVLLVLLVLGDLFAVRMYHAHADWPTLRRMVPAVVVGVGLGTVFLGVADDATVQRVIGAILLVLVAVTLVRRAAARRGERVAAAASHPAAASATALPAVSPEASPREGASAAEATRDDAPPGWRRRLDTGAYGSVAGFTTMVANAGGPVMSMYFLAARFPMGRFLGTAAWFFLVVNVAKLPFSVGLGLIDRDTLTLDLVLAPAVVVGALVGRRVAGRLDQAVFDRLVLVLTVVSAGYLVVA